MLETRYVCRLSSSDLHPPLARTTETVKQLKIGSEYTEDIRTLHVPLYLQGWKIFSCETRVARSRRNFWVCGSKVICPTQYNEQGPDMFWTVTAAVTHSSEHHELWRREENYNSMVAYTLRRLSYFNRNLDFYEGGYDSRRKTWKFSNGSTTHH
jgi:hypothetical protein